MRLNIKILGWQTLTSRLAVEAFPNLDDHLPRSREATLAVTGELELRPDLGAI